LSNGFLCSLQLQSAQSTWQSKVGEKDAEKFTVAAKMQKIGKSDLPRPTSMIVTPLAATPVKTSLRSSATPSVSSSSGDERDVTERIKRTPKPRRFCGSPPPPSSSFDDSDDVAAASQRHASGSGAATSTSNDDGIETFFSGVTAASKRVDNLDVSVGDFDLLVPESEAPLVHHRKAAPKIQNRRQRGSKNPVKQLSAR